MTFSIVARCIRSGQFGIAAATAMPAVGKLLAYAAAGRGAVATQARINPYLGIEGLELLRQGLGAQAARSAGEDRSALGSAPGGGAGCAGVRSDSYR